MVVTVNGAPTGVIRPSRVISNGTAAALVTGNFAGLSGGWGVGASCSAVSGNEVAGTFTITAGSSGTGSSPTLTYAYPGGAYAVAPTAICLFIGGSGAGTMHQVGIAAGVSSCSLQPFFTPSANQTYQYAIFVIG